MKTYNPENLDAALNVRDYIITMEVISPVLTTQLSILAKYWYKGEPHR